MSDLTNYTNKVTADLAAGVISPQVANQMIHQATLLADPKGNLGANDRLGLRYGHLKNPPPTPPPPPPPPPPPAATVPNTGGNTTVSTISAPPPIPETIWDTKSTYVAPTGVKQATPDIIVFDEEVDPEFLVEAFFQEFGGTELINISRHDLINGDNVSYSPIKNLSSLRQSFNPNNIIAIGAFQENPTKYGIDLFSRGVAEPYFDDNGNLVIEINDVRPDESIETEIASDGTINRIEL
jgi:hypothetical protein